MFEVRIKKLQKILGEKNLDAILISSPSNIFYLTGRDDFSHEEREAYLFVTRKSAVLFTDMRYIHGIKNSLPANVMLINITDMFKRIKKANSNPIGIEENLTVYELKRFRKETSKKYKMTDKIVSSLRTQKDRKEASLLRSATTLTDTIYKYAVPKIKIGISEVEMASLIERYIKDHGGVLAFDTIVAFGANSAIPHHKTSNKKLSKSDEFILLDFGAKIGGYSADMTRTILPKSASLRAKRVYKTVWQAQTLAAQKIMAGEREMSKIANVVNEFLQSKKFADVPHGLGHGIGIDVHEFPSISPKSKGKLAEGMAFTIEPGIYIPGFGGVRIEDDFIITGNKLIQLTKSPK